MAVVAEAERPQAEVPLPAVSRAAARRAVVAVAAAPAWPPAEEVQPVAAEAQPRAARRPEAVVAAEAELQRPAVWAQAEQAVAAAPTRLAELRQAAEQPEAAVPEEAAERPEAEAPRERSRRPEVAGWAATREASRSPRGRRT